MISRVTYALCCAAAAALAIGLLGRPVYAQDSGPATTASALEERLEQLDKALAEIERQQVELERQRGDLEALKADLAAVKSAPEPENRWTYSGFVQAQSAWLDRGQGGPQYQLRRLYNVLTYDYDDRAAGCLLLNTTSQVFPLDAWIETRRGNVRFRLGQFIPPTGYDTQRSSSVRHAHEYSTAYSRLFPGIYDQGFMIYTASRNPAAGVLRVSFTNGSGPNAPDSNAAKDVVLHYSQPFAGGKGRFHLTGAWGLSTVTYPNANPVTSPKSLVSAGIGYTSRRLDSQAEAVFGSAYGNNVLGGYGETAYKAGKHTLYGRYEYYAPSTANPGALTSGPILGYEYALGPRDKLGLEVAILTDRVTSYRDGRVTLRWQATW